MTVSHKAFIGEDPSVSEGDRLHVGSARYVIRAVVNQAGMDRLWRLDVEELK